MESILETNEELARLIREKVTTRFQMLGAQASPAVPAVTRNDGSAVGFDFDNELLQTQSYQRVATRPDESLSTVMSLPNPDDDLDWENLSMEPLGLESSNLQFLGDGSWDFDFSSFSASAVENAEYFERAYAATTSAVSDWPQSTETTKGGQSPPLEQAALPKKPSDAGQTLDDWAQRSLYSLTISWGVSHTGSIFASLTLAEVSLDSLKTQPWLPVKLSNALWTSDRPSPSLAGEKQVGSLKAQVGVPAAHPTAVGTEDTASVPVEGEKQTPGVLPSQTPRSIS